MTTRIRLNLAVLMVAVFVVAAASTGIYLLGTSTGEPVAVGTGIDTKLPPAPSEQKGAPANPVITADTVPVETRKPVLDLATEGRTFELGVRGRVVDDVGQPVAGAEVFLMPGMGAQVMKVFRLYQEGVRFPPVARSVTAGDGVFTLGIGKFEGAQYEVRVKHDGFCDAVSPSLVPQPGSWVDVVLQLKRGVRVFGRVSSESNLPIAGATISLRDGGGQLVLAPMPGREHGLTTVTDQSGAFEFRHVDPVRRFAMRASAPGFATKEKSELRFEEDVHHQHDFVLTQGLAIAGTVGDTRGKRIGGATITVSALSQKSRIMETATTDAEGRFAVSGLEAGPYAVQVVASGYLKIDDKPVEAGTETLEYIMEQQGRVLVTVLGADGRPLPSYHCNLKTAIQGQDTYGGVVLGKAVVGARNGTAELGGVDPMTCVAEVFADGYAKTFSEPFTITESQTEPQRVTVRLNRGGAIAGTVTDFRGAPIQGVKVSTRPVGMTSKVLQLFPVPYTITRREATTDQNGRFELALLNPGAYQLELEHARYCTEYVHEVAVSLDQRMELNGLKMTHGCLASGITSFEGRPQGQIKVTVSAVLDRENRVPFTAEAISDDEGKFLLDKRLRPGRYEVMVANHAQANPLVRIVQLNKSKREILVPAGRELFEIRIDVPKIQ